VRELGRIPKGRQTPRAPGEFQADTPPDELKDLPFNKFPMVLREDPGTILRESLPERSPQPFPHSTPMSVKPNESNLLILKSPILRYQIVVILPLPFFILTHRNTRPVAANL
jgi:hypothetical protein